MSSLVKVIEVDQEKCINCHKCISVCPVKYCNSTNGDVIEVNPDLCIGCGSCIKACPHDARKGIDDFSQFLGANSRGEKLIAIAAPAAAANFPDKYLKLNGWLKSMGVQAIFDVSFGAELTVKSYLEYVKANNPKTVIAQPCPAIVTYIEIYRPELIKYLAPADSPMLHTVKMVKEFYPEFKNNKVVVLSPCYAKKREFEETGFGDYNITYKSIDQYIKENKINLAAFPEIDYSNDPAERAVLFSTPGGLMRTVEREAPGISEKTRKIEGPHTIYHYLNDLDRMVDNSKAPLLVDCLNCEMGCNGGPGTLNTHKPVDEVEFLIEKRNKEMQKRYAKRGPFSKIRAKRNLQKHIDKYWKPGLYDRKYKNHSENVKYVSPSENDLKSIYEKMHKFSDEDMYNCSACGYDSCRDMAVAIYNGLNKPENCFQRNVHIIDDIDKAVEKIEKFGDGDLDVTLDYSNNDLRKLFASINSAIHRVRNIVFEISEVISASKSVSMSVSSSLQNLSTGAVEQSTQTQEISTAISQMTSTILETTRNANSAADYAKKSAEISDNGSKVIYETVNGINKIAEVVNHASSSIRQLGDNGNKIGEIIKVIDEIAEQTNLLALNAAIEAARAGEQGRGFAVVADEVRKLADRTTRATKEIAGMIRIIQQDTESAVDSISEGAEQVNKGIALANESGASLQQIRNGVYGTVDSITQVAAASEEQSKAAEQISTNIDAISSITSQSVEMTHNIARDMETLLAHTDSLTELIRQFKFRESTPVRRAANFSGMN